MYSTRSQSYINMSPTKKRSTHPFFKPSSNVISTSPTKRKRSTLVQCPCCKKRIYSHVINQHLDICKPPKTITNVTTSSSSASPIVSQNTNSIATATVYFCLTYTNDGNYVITTRETTCDCINISERPYFSQLIHLRDYDHPYSFPKSIIVSSTIQTQLSITPSILVQSQSNMTIRTQLQLHTSHELLENTSLLAIFDLPAGSIASRLPLSVLKSALRKNIRRGKAAPAIRVAIVLIRRQSTGLFDFLRRLCVIIIEDAILHPLYDFVVWFMTACSRNYRVSKRDMYTILKCVYDITIVKTVDTLIYDNNNNKDENQQDIDFGKSLVTALRIRASYGGMKCDQEMLQSATKVWKNRFSNEKRQSWMNFIKQIYQTDRKDSETMIHQEQLWIMFKKENEVLKTGDIGLEAWDFHCCSVSEQVSKVFEQNNNNVGERILRYTKRHELKVIQFVEKLIWKYRSSVSIKRELIDEHDNIKEEMKNENQTNLEELNIWQEDVQPLVNQWCRTFRKRYGL